MAVELGAFTAYSGFGKREDKWAKQSSLDIYPIYGCQIEHEGGVKGLPYVAVIALLRNQSEEISCDE